MGTARNHSNKMYQSWCKMKSRCNNPNNPAYKNYGARGIKVCDRWQDFDKYIEDMGHRPEGMTLERIDNDKGYYPENCRWATKAEQNRNTRKNRHFTLDGVTKILSDWVKESDVKPSTVYQRYYVYKWPIDKALGRK